jgi:hypothetical protein
MATSHAPSLCFVPTTSFTRPPAVRRSQHTQRRRIQIRNVDPHQSAGIAFARAPYVYVDRVSDPFGVHARAFKRLAARMHRHLVGRRKRHALEIDRIGPRCSVESRP